jgi:hypothetical protein
VCVCVCVCLCACVRACVRVCMYVCERGGGGEGALSLLPARESKRGGEGKGRRDLGRR